MTTRASWTDRTGTWQGTNRLWFDPAAPAFESASTARLRDAAGADCLLLEYTWSHEERGHDGVLLLHLPTGAGPIEAVWCDSFHSGGGLLHFQGTLDAEHGIDVLGSYAAPEGPDWGWRIQLLQEAGAGWQLRMFNISPAGEEFPAVAVDYRRV